MIVAQFFFFQFENSWNSYNYAFLGHIDISVVGDPTQSIEIMWNYKISSLPLLSRKDLLKFDRLFLLFGFQNDGLFIKFSNFSNNFILFTTRRQMLSSQFR